MWVSLPALPLPLFNAVYIAKLAGLLGRCLKIDAATLALRRPSVARVLIEMDVSKQPPHRIWIGEDQEGFWQDVEYESWPKFCGFCSRFGHEEDECYRRNPDLQPPKGLRKRTGKAMEVYRPKVNNGQCLQQRETLTKQVESQQRTDGALVLGRGIEGKIDAKLDTEVIAPSGLENATAAMGRVVHSQELDWARKAPALSTCSVSVGTEALVGTVTDPLVDAADVLATIPESSSRDAKEVEQGPEDWETQSLVAVSSNPFAVLHTIRLGGARF